MSNLNVVPFPADGDEVAEGLRRLADEIDAGLLVHNLVYVADLGNGDVDVKILGHVREKAPLVYTLLGLAQSKVIRLLEENVP